MGNMVFVRGWPWMGNVVWFVDGGIWGMGVFVDGGMGIRGWEWRMDVLDESRMEETSN